MTVSTTTSASVPRITPKRVKPERKGCPLISSKLVRMDSPICMLLASLGCVLRGHCPRNGQVLLRCRIRLVATTAGNVQLRCPFTLHSSHFTLQKSLAPQRLDRIEPRRADGGIHPEQKPGSGGEGQSPHTCT